MGLIATAVEDAYKHLAQSVIRDYILLLVERRAGMELALLAANPESIVRADSNRLTHQIAARRASHHRRFCRDGVIDTGI